MTEQVEKSAEEQLAEIVKAEAGAIAETKADVSAVEELKSALAAATATIEEMKADKSQAEALEAAKSEILETVETKMNSVSAPSVNLNHEDVRLQKWWDFGKYEGKDVVKNFTLDAYDGIYKAENSNNNTADTPVGGIGVVTPIDEANPFRAISMVMPVSTASFKIPKLSGVTSNKNENAGSQTEAGSVAATTVNVNHYNSYFTASLAFEDDIMGLDMAVSRRMAAAIGADEAADCVSALDGATITEHAFATGAAFDDIGNWIDLVSALSPQYRANATLVVNDLVYGQLRGATTANTASALEFDVTIGAPRFLGYPIVVTSHLDDPAASANPAYFGDFSQTLIIGARRELQMKRLVDTVVLDGIAYYMSMRSGQGIGVAEAMVRADQTAA